MNLSVNLLLLPVALLKKYYKSIKQLLIVSRKGGEIILIRQTPNSEVESASTFLLMGSVRK